MKTAKMPHYQRMDKENVVFGHTGKPLPAIYLTRDNNQNLQQVQKTKLPKNQ
jgi:hypothetical protein